MPEFVADDPESWIREIVGKVLRNYRTYQAEVKEQLPAGYVRAHSVEYGTLDSEPESWLTVAPGNQFYSFVQPEVGDTVELYFPDGTPNRPRYRALSPYYYSSPSGSAGVFVLFELGQFKIECNSQSGALTIQRGETSVVLNASTLEATGAGLTASLTGGRLEVGDGSISVANGDTLQGYLEDLRESLNALYTAIQNTATTPLDGGASFKAGLVTAIQETPLPQIPNDLLDTNTKVGPE